MGRLCESKRSREPSCKQADSEASFSACFLEASSPTPMMFASLSATNVTLMVLYSGMAPIHEVSVTRRGYNFMAIANHT